MSRRVYALAAIALCAVIFVAINIAADAGLTTARLDLTENGQFTLAQGTRHILANLKEPVTLKFYYSKKVAATADPQIVDYAKRVRDMLTEYASLSHGNVIVQEINPEPLTDTADQAQAAGLSGVPINDAGDTLFFGLVGTNRVDGKEVIAFFSPDREQYLEYDLSSLVYRLSTQKKTVIGILSSLPLQFGPGGIQAAMQGRSEPYVIYQELTRNYQTQLLPPNFAKLPDPKDMNVLLIAHPAPLSDVQLQAIDQFVLKGGRALIFVDPDSGLAQAGANPYQPPASPPSSDLPKLFRAWGIGYEPAKILADRKYAQRVQTRDPANPVALYPIWLHLTTESFNLRDPVSANLQTLNLATAGALHPLKGATTAFTPLVSSSKDAALLDTATAKSTQDPDELMNMIKPASEPFAIAARISGEAKTAFPNASVKSGQVNIVVMADSDVFDDRFWVRVQTVLGNKIGTPIADNAAFVMNGIENLSGSSDLITLRTREAAQRPFTVVRDLQEKEQGQLRAKEKALQQDLNQKLQQLQKLKGGSDAEQGGAELTPEQKTQVDNMQQDIKTTSRQLRDLQHDLRKDIDALGDRLAFVNIVIVPGLVIAFAIVQAWLRRRRRARAKGA
jgi:ABC-type uncharacterized transport system involved in gliding motility auxiliary subunit